MRRATTPALEMPSRSAAACLVERDDEAFWVVSGDIFAPGFAFDAAAAQRFAHGDAQAHVWARPNPPFLRTATSACGRRPRLATRPPDGSADLRELALARSLCTGIARARARRSPLLVRAHARAPHNRRSTAGDGELGTRRSSPH